MTGPRLLTVERCMDCRYSESHDPIHKPDPTGQMRMTCGNFDVPRDHFLDDPDNAVPEWCPLPREGSTDLDRIAVMIRRVAAAAYDSGHVDGSSGVAHATDEKIHTLTMATLESVRDGWRRR